jgi:chemotaxis protein histidine kinase CheA
MFDLNGPKKDYENENIQPPLKIISLDQTFFQEIITRILDCVSKVENKLLVMKTNPKDTSLCVKTRRFFQLIIRWADMVEADPIQDIARHHVVLLEKWNKNELTMNRATIDWLLASISYIKKLCADFSLNFDPVFIALVKEHLNRFPVNDQELAKVDTYDDTQIKRLGDILVEQKRLTPKELNELLALQKENPNKFKLGQLALSQEKINPEELLESLKIQTESIILLFIQQETEEETAPTFLKKLPNPEKDDSGL